MPLFTGFQKTLIFRHQIEIKFFMTKISAAITGVGGFVPQTILTNADLERMVDTTDEWITTRNQRKAYTQGARQGYFRHGCGSCHSVASKNRHPA